MKTQNEHWRKKNYQKATLETKLLVVDQILNGQLSNNQASKKYDVPRTTISYWLRKYSTLVQQNTGMSKNDEIKRLKEKIEELEFQKDFQQDIIADMELITGVDMSKKSLPKTLAKEIELKKKQRIKENGSMDVLGYLNKPSTKDSKHNKNNK
ncbi:transposase [Wenyingzhuangia heitensis]|uniref:Transposase n=1 Tax=Wenyingzhuangia heitensis TaxID=1487859 RepID=A0ABX0UBI1_9FLAO|nr:helix-turn-helix domain-containing protein [Wenyingzhuangia heitensis]NIJ45275.1 transposase [Wenyingzhuangia heitensis]